MPVRKFSFLVIKLIELNRVTYSDAPCSKKKREPQSEKGAHFRMNRISKSISLLAIECITSIKTFKKDKKKSYNPQ